MRILICGAGRITRELLRRLGEGWEVSLIDTRREQLDRTAPLFPNIAATYEADASSKVVLNKASVRDMDYVLALTSDDEVNLAVAELAQAAGVEHVSALVYDDSTHTRFQEMGVHVIQGPGLIAQNLSHYLQDPRLHVQPLISGAGSVYEVDASQHFRAVGKRAAYFNTQTGRLVALFRKGRLVFPKPKTPVKSGDKLVLVGDPDMFEPVCRMLECGDPHFPLAYGQGMLLAMGDRPPEDRSAYNPLLEEGLYLARNTKVQRVVILCPEEECGIEPALKDWPQEVQVETRPAGREVETRMRELCAEGNYGLVVMPPPQPSVFKTLFRAPLVDLARILDTPLLITRTTFAYDSILVPFNGTAMSELALEVGVDLSRQLGGAVRVAVVEEPEFLSGEDEAQTVDTLLARIRELSHVHKTEFEVIRREGNPVREITALSRDHGLMVIGSTTRDTGFFTPNVGDHLARKAECSVLLLAS